jgi:hypothetical protein
MKRYKKGDWVKYQFTGTNRFCMLLITGSLGDYYTYRKSIQLPRLPLTRWEEQVSDSYIHINGGLFQDQECINMQRQQKLERILKNDR